MTDLDFGDSTGICILQTHFVMNYIIHNFHTLSPFPGDHQNSAESSHIDVASLGTDCKPSNFHDNQKLFADDQVSENTAENMYCSGADVQSIEFVNLIDDCSNKSTPELVDLASIGGQKPFMEYRLVKERIVIDNSKYLGKEISPISNRGALNRSKSFELNRNLCVSNSADLVTMDFPPLMESMSRSSSMPVLTPEEPFTNSVRLVSGSEDTTESNVEMQENSMESMEGKYCGETPPPGLGASEVTGEGNVEVLEKNMEGIVGNYSGETPPDLGASEVITEGSVEMLEENMEGMEDNYSEDTSPDEGLSVADEVTVQKCMESRKCNYSNDVLPRDLRIVDITFSSSIVKNFLMQGMNHDKVNVSAYQFQSKADDNTSKFGETSADLGSSYSDTECLRTTSNKVPEVTNDKVAENDKVEIRTELENGSSRITHDSVVEDTNGRQSVQTVSAEGTCNIENGVAVSFSTDVFGERPNLELVRDDTNRGAVQNDGICRLSEDCHFIEDSDTEDLMENINNAIGKVLKRFI